MDQLLKDKAAIGMFGKLVMRMTAAFRNENTVYVIGNGGSMAQAAHFIGELVGRFENNERPPLRAGLLSDVSLMSALINDYPPEDVFARQLRGLLRKGDLVIALSTSGSSRNVYRAIRMAHDWGARTFGITGNQETNTLRSSAEESIALPSQTTAEIQEMTLMVIPAVCEEMDKAFSP
jgi:D-sedoheptulose 7-phosphate isomerase